MNEEKKLIFKKATSDPNQGDVIIEITDVQFHTTNMRGTGSIGKTIKKSIERKQPGRIYFPLSGKDQTEKESIASGINMQDPSLQKMIEEYQKQGKRVFLKIPNNTIPVFPGKDTTEFINSTKGGRISRKLAMAGN